MLIDLIPNSAPLTLKNDDLTKFTNYHAYKMPNPETADVTRFED